jgi:hypothetical protein
MDGVDCAGPASEDLSKAHSVMAFTGGGCPRRRTVRVTRSLLGRWFDQQRGIAWLRAPADELSSASADCA